MCIMYVMCIMCVAHVWCIWYVQYMYNVYGLCDMYVMYIWYVLYMYNVCDVCDMCMMYMWYVVPSGHGTHVKIRGKFCGVIFFPLLLPRFTGSNSPESFTGCSGQGNSGSLPETTSFHSFKYHTFLVGTAVQREGPGWAQQAVGSTPWLGTKSSEWPTSPGKRPSHHVPRWLRKANLTQACHCCTQWQSWEHAADTGAESRQVPRKPMSLSLAPCSGHNPSFR